MIRDPIVEEIHQIRKKIWDECGGDFAKWIERLKVREAEHPDRIVSLEEFRKRLSARKSG